MMTTAHEDEDLALPLLHRSARPSALPAQIEAEQDIPVRHLAHANLMADRLQPASAGALAGAVAGGASLGLVHALHATAIGEGISRLAATWGVPDDAGLPLAYLAAVVIGAVIGMGFASVTQHLRRLVPLLVWAEVFFVSLTMLVLALSSTYGRGLGVALAPAILGASAVFAFLASFQLKLRVRSAS